MLTRHSAPHWHFTFLMLGIYTYKTFTNMNGYIFCLAKAENYGKTLSKNILNNTVLNKICDNGCIKLICNNISTIAIRLYSWSNLKFHLVKQEDFTILERHIITSSSITCRHSDQHQTAMPWRSCSIYWDLAGCSSAGRLMGVQTGSPTNSRMALM